MYINCLLIGQKIDAWQTERHAAFETAAICPHPGSAGTYNREEIWFLYGRGAVAKGPAKSQKSAWENRNERPFIRFLPLAFFFKKSIRSLGLDILA